ncbi:MAG: hypothetical protein IJU40_07590 [Desulfovibrionaceae bacterium]|nr:hypothetical protein [Desulfovibrionaceae bacterium]
MSGQVASSLDKSYRERKRKTLLWLIIAHGDNQAELNNVKRDFKTQNKSLPS